MIVRPLVVVTRATFIALAIALLAPPAEAQQQAPSATALSLAREIVLVKGGAGLYEPMVPGVIERAKLVFLQYNPLLGRDLNDVAAKLRMELAGRTSELIAEAAKLYATRFSEQELKDAVEFYRTPLGRKLVSEEPAIIEASLNVLRDWQKSFGEEVMIKFREEMKKKGHDL
jgi:hypothetical protein